MRSRPGVLLSGHTFDGPSKAYREASAPNRGNSSQIGPLIAQFQ